jgi:DNA-binding SARP family transcriptional activator
MIRLTTFGGLSVDNVTLVSGASHPRGRLAILAVLAVSRDRGVRRERLTALFWPDSDEERARNALRQAMFAMRRDLGVDELTLGGAELRLNPSVITSDVADFETAIAAGRFDEAVSLYRGPFLDGVYIKEAPEFEHWSEEQRVRLAAAKGRALEELARRATQAGELATAAEWWERRAADDPLSSRVARAHMEALASVGDREKAIARAAVHTALIRQELGAEPDRDLVAFAERLHQSSLGSGGAKPGVTTRSTRGPPTADTHIPSHQSDSSPSSAVAARVPVERRRSQRLPLVIGVTAVLAVGMTAVLVRLRTRTPDSHRVLVAALENRTGDPALDRLGTMAADWITQGLRATGLTEVVDPMSTLLAARQLAPDSSRGDHAGLALANAMARRAAATIVVWGAVYRQDDSLIYRVQITDLTQRRQFPSIEPVSARVEDAVGGADKLRAKVAGALAVALDERIASVSDAASRPPSFAAYQEYMIGLEEFVLRDQVRAVPHFEEASRLDPEFTQPLIWAAFAYGNSHQTVKRDSVIALLAERRERLTPLDRYALEYFVAGQRHDRRAQFDAARSAARLSPGSEWSHNAGVIAMERNRPADALEFLLAIDPEHGWVRTFAPYWDNLLNAYHLTGRYEDELRAAQRLEALYGEGPTVRANSARPLIALGRVDDAERLAEILLLRPHNAHSPGGNVQVIAQEFWAHGYVEQSRRLMDRTIAWYRAAIDGAWANTQPNPKAWRLIFRRTLGRMLYEAGRYDEAQEVNAAIANGDSAETGPRGYLGLLAAHRGDRAEAERVMQMLATPFAEAHMPFRGPEYMEAQIAAELGDRERAVTLLRQSMEKNPNLNLALFLHMEVGWAKLRDYPPFLALARQEK